MGQFGATPGDFDEHGVDAASTLQMLVALEDVPGRGVETLDVAQSDVLLQRDLELFELRGPLGHRVEALLGDERSQRIGLGLELVGPCHEICLALELDDGADVLDLGAASSHPEAEAVAADEEIRRLAPVIEAAASRAGVDVAEVRVLTAQAMVWSDGSLDCPQPGEVYTQAPVPGYWVVVEGPGAAFNYRLTERGAFRLCTNRSRFSIASSARAMQIWWPAIAD